MLIRKIGLVLPVNTNDKSQMKNLGQIERIKIKLRLAKSTDSFLEVFGASSHKYIIKEPLVLEEVEQFELANNISLPEGYKAFFTQVGHGGIDNSPSITKNCTPGPDYGLFPLNLSAKINPYGFLEKEPYFNEEMTEEIWIKRFYDEIDDSTDELYNREVERAYSGTMEIGCSGCTNYLSIVLNGKNRDRVIHVHEGTKYLPRLVAESCFLDWYEAWLDGILSGKTITMKGNTSLQTERACIAELLGRTNTYWKFVSLAYIRSFKTLSTDSIETLWKQHRKENDDRVKLYILNLLTKFDYANCRSEIKKLSKYPLEFLRNLHLYARDHTKDWLNDIDKIERENANKVDVMEYIQYLTREEM